MTPGEPPPARHCPVFAAYHLFCHYSFFPFPVHPARTGHAHHAPCGATALARLPLLWTLCAALRWVARRCAGILSAAPRPRILQLTAAKSHSWPGRGMHRRASNPGEAGAIASPTIATPSAASAHESLASSASRSARPTAESPRSRLRAVRSTDRRAVARGAREDRHGKTNAGGAAARLITSGDAADPAARREACSSPPSPRLQS